MKAFKVIGVFLVLGLLLSGGYFYSQFTGTGKDLPRERFVVKLNTSEEQIIDDLHQQGFLKSKWLFGLVLDFKKLRGKTEGPERSRRIEPGAYLISKSLNAYQLAGTLVYGPFQKWVVIPPGKRKEQVAFILQKTLSWPYGLARSFINQAKEGYLYPDTYLINTDADPGQIIQKLTNIFNEKFDAEIQQDLLSQNIRNDTAIKIASLIERESGSLEDKPIIAGIILNRLNENMKLEIDATVQYAIASENLNDAGLQTLEDFNFWPKLGAGVVRTIDSPYNTYKIIALPPGPICTPSLDSIKAVANPAQTDALYYLHSADKQIHTAKTYKEHQENIKKYLQ